MGATFLTIPAFAVASHHVSAARKARFALTLALCGEHRRGKHLERNLSIQSGVVRAVDDALAAAADELHEVIASGDDGAVGRGFGVPGTRADTCEEMDRALRRALAEPGPALIEAVI